RRHQPVGVLVMLVDAYAIEPEVLGGGELVDVVVVGLVHDFGIEEVVRHPHPRGLVVLCEVRGQLRVGHQVEQEMFHAVLLLARSREVDDNVEDFVAGTSPPSVKRVQNRAASSGSRWPRPRNCRATIKPVPTIAAATRSGSSLPRVPAAQSGSKSSRSSSVASATALRPRSPCTPR